MPRSPSGPPVLNLEQIRFIAQSTANENVKLCHVFAIFANETQDRVWNLIDAHVPVIGVNFKLCGDLTKYPKIQPGDVVRVHRVSFDKTRKCPYIPTGLNVVAWKSFQSNDDCHPIYSSERPSISEEDEHERRKLEDLCSNLRTRISELNLQFNKYFTVAGRLEFKETNKYGNLICTLFDGTGKCRLRLFSKVNDKECNDHFEVASSLGIGEYLIVFCAKLLEKKDCHIPFLDLSANFSFGRCLRKVSKSSILGIHLTERINEEIIDCQSLPSNSPRSSTQLAPEQQSEPQQEVEQIETELSQEQQSLPQQEQQSPRLLPRRSPRLNANIQSQHQQQEQVTPQQFPAHQLEPVPRQKTPQPNAPLLRNVADEPATRVLSQSILSQTTPNQSPIINNLFNNNIGEQASFPKYTKLCDLIRKSEGKYDFYNLAGQIRGQPRESPAFKNWLFQLYDGSKFTYGDCNLGAISEPIENCITIIVYSAQYPQDRDDHIRKVKTLNDGDLVMIYNIRAFWRDGKVRLEMQANTNHGKRIELIDKTSAFGMHLLESLVPLDAEELNEEQQVNAHDDTLDSMVMERNEAELEID